jgi:MFS family permease
MRQPRGYLPLLLAFIFIDETCSNYILNAFANRTSVLEFSLYLTFLLVSIITAPIQAGYSDFFCRKKSLIVSLSFSLLSCVLVFFSLKNTYSPLIFLFIGIVIKAALGNTLPLSWAAISDTQNKNFRFSLALSTSAMAFGYIVLIIIKRFFTDHSAFVISVLFAILIYLCIRYFRDIRDKKEHETPQDANTLALFKTSIKEEIKLIINNFLKDKRIRKALSAFLLWEVSFYSALIVDIDMKIDGFNDLSLSMLLGYFAGVLLLKFSKKTDLQMIKIGYILSICALVPILLLNFLFDMRLLIISCYFIYSIAAAFLAPSLFSILSRERKPHEQGKIYGLIDSTDTIAFLIASIYLILYNTLHLNPLFLVIFSLTAFVISWIPYAKFKKIKARTYQEN